MDSRKNNDCRKQKEKDQPQHKACGRRDFLKGAVKVAALGSAAMVSGNRYFSGNPCYFPIYLKAVNMF